MTELKSDGELVRDFVERGSEQAFADLVERHTNLVFATASRGVSDPAAAAEVTQSVFIALARKAAGLRRQPTLAGWLHRTTLLEVRQWWRGEMRRRTREQTAAELGTTMKEDDSLLKSMAVLLDDGLLHLREADRQLLLLRYIEGRTHRDIALLLGAGEDTIRKRVDKALEALTQFFRGRGVAVPAVTITATALSASVLSAPAGLSALVTKAALASAATASLGGLGAFFGRLAGLTNPQMAALCLFVAAIPLTVQWDTNRRLAREQAALQARVEASAAELASQNEDAESLRRRLLQSQNRRVSLEDRAKLLQARAAAGARAAVNEAPSYLWSEASPYVLVPKGVLKDLGLPALPNRAGTEVVLSPVMAEALSLQPEELSRVNALLGEAKSTYDQLVASHAQPTNGHIRWFGPNDGPMRSFIVAPFPEEGDSLIARLKNDLEQTIGSARMEIFWAHAEAGLRNRLSEVGKAERWLTVHLTKSPQGGFTPSYYEDIRGKVGRGDYDPPEFMKRAAAEAQSAGR
jgi:RNA polymerase sigma factor (sigma-70 family)